MHAIDRRPAAAGVALLGATVIAASAVLPAANFSLPQALSPHVLFTDVGLTAASDPLELYRTVFLEAGANLKTLLENTHPGQVVGQLIANQISSAVALGHGLATAGGGVADALTTQVPELVDTAFTELAAGNIAGATNALLQIPLAVVVPAAGLLPVLGDVLTKPLQNVINVIHAFTADPLATLLAVSGFIAPLISIPAAAAEAIQTVVSSVGTGDPKALVHALVSAPAVFLGGVLNGGIGPDLGPLVSPGLPVKAGGLLSSAGFVFNDDGSFYLNTGGPLYSLQQVLKLVKDAITPATTPATTPVPATDEVTAIPSAGAATVTLTTKDAAPAEDAAPIKDAAPAADDASAHPAAPVDPRPATTDDGAETAPSDTGDAASDPVAPPSSTPEHDAEAATGEATDEPASPRSGEATKSDDDTAGAHPAGGAVGSGDAAGATRPTSARPTAQHHLPRAVGKAKAAAHAG
ncbi:hypothetical protein BST22_06120 [Mycolicibacterium chubuense]|uniref:PE-PGRS family protein n=1 Tax=Mycolicibacterium chubuense TaxID=1800 RepID=A0A0J6VUK6_MYCCU|nr:hypothetical protein [Mycolicibacterium chubuense]KMO73859.1 hypothetical protein MCHUDSM44219_03911 [Mycolicibacterium chubuense]ORA54963.1 hypothetical protein BST22_06120 [Mycolicibacterium chubuense]SPX97661.1 Uncharacterised protein [Mycolicibacterium chubuense]